MSHDAQSSMIGDHVLQAPRERICRECGHYGFRRGNPESYRWSYCFKKQKWFPESIEFPGERKGCEEWA